jgi:hypothetical protein
MCWTIITRYKKLAERLSSHKGRGLDSVWIVNLKYGRLYKYIREDLYWYLKWIESQDEHDWLCIMHNRKASIWNITIDNAHPFKIKKFWLLQNWTCKEFMKTYKNIYKKETDSETLLTHIETKADTIKWWLNVLQSITDTLWIVILISIKEKRVLVYTDWLRESYIKIQNWYLKEFSNLQPDDSGWFKNKWYLIIDYEWKIIEKEFEDKLNTELFHVPVVVPDKRLYNDRSSYYDYRNTSEQIKAEQLALQSNTLTLFDTELLDSWLSNKALRLLINNRITTYEQLYELTNIDLAYMHWMTRELLTEIEEMFLLWWIWRAKDPEENEEEEGEEEEEKFINKNLVPLWKVWEQFFYSEEILEDDWLLYSDMLCYIYRSSDPLLKWYAYQHMWIPYEIAIKRVVWKAKYKKMKLLFKAARDRAFKDIIL